MRIRGVLSETLWDVPAMNCLALLLALSVASSPGEDLAGLSSDDAGVRELATRRLCGELAP